MGKPNSSPSQSAPISDDRGASVVPLRGLPPAGNTLTPYDTKNLSLYMCLLVHEEDGASIADLATGIFGFDMTRDREWAIRVTLLHLRRARWVVDQLYPWID